MKSPITLKTVGNAEGKVCGASICTIQSSRPLIFIRRTLGERHINVSRWAMAELVSGRNNG